MFMLQLIYRLAEICQNPENPLRLASSVEFIFEMDRSTYNRTHKGRNSATQLLYEKDGIEYVNIVTQYEGISG